MNISKIIVIAVSLTIAAAGQLPKVIAAVRKAQVQLLQQSKTNSWGRVNSL